MMKMFKWAVPLILLVIVKEYNAREVRSVENAAVTPECGVLSPKGNGKLPWHATVYVKSATEDKDKVEDALHIKCGGSILSDKTVVTVSECLYSHKDNRSIPPNIVHVAIGNVYNEWNDARDEHAQKFEVEKIEFSTSEDQPANNTRFVQGLAILTLKTSIAFTDLIKPVCIDWDVTVNKEELAEKDINGVITGCDLNNDTKQPDLEFKPFTLPTISNLECKSISTNDFLSFVTKDSFCAGDSTNVIICVGVFGNGLCFPKTENGIDRYYLKGVGSMAIIPKDLTSCPTYSTFTSIDFYLDWLKSQHIR